MHQGGIRPGATTVVALVLIAITGALVIADGNATNFLVCRADCGETLIAEQAVERFKVEGFKFGLIQNHGTVDAPYLYTHNVHIGALIYAGLYAVGVDDFRGRQLVTLVGFLVGLFYIFLTCRSYSHSGTLGIVVLCLFCASYWSVLSFAFNALRAWHFTALFGTLFHARECLIARNAHRGAHLIGLGVAAVIAFGCGYDFWVICGAAAVMVVIVEHLIDGNWKPIPKHIAVLSAAFLVPFVLRQLQIISVLGPTFWTRDLIYSVAMKVPGASTLIDIPSIDGIDDFYRTRGVLRPPTTPTNSFVAILATGQDMVRMISVPRWGALSWVLFVGSFMTGVWLALRTIAARSRPTLAVGATLITLLVPLGIGIVIGLFVFAPFSLHVYLKHEFPLIAAPLLVAKGVVFYWVGTRLARGHSLRLRAAAVIAMTMLVLEMGAIHLAAWNEGLQPNLGWIEDLRRLPQGTKVAISGYWSPQFRNVLGLDHLQIDFVDPADARDMLQLDASARSYLSSRRAPRQSDVDVGMPLNHTDSETLPASQYFVYQPVSRSPTYNFDAPSPDCAWQDPVWRGLQRRFAQADVVTFRPLMIAPTTPTPGSIVSVIGEVSGDVGDISKVRLVADKPSLASVDPSPVYNCIYRTVTAWVRLPDALEAPFVALSVEVEYRNSRRVLIDGFRIDVSSEGTLAAEPVVAFASAQPTVRELKEEFASMPVLAASDDRGSAYIIFELPRSSSRLSSVDVAK